MKRIKNFKNLFIYLVLTYKNKKPNLNKFKTLKDMLKKIYFKMEIFINF